MRRTCCRVNITAGSAIGKAWCTARVMRRERGEEGDESDDGDGELMLLLLLLLLLVLVVVVVAVVVPFAWGVCTEMSDGGGWGFDGFHMS